MPLTRLLPLLLSLLFAGCRRETPQTPVEATVSPAPRTLVSRPETARERLVVHTASELSEADLGAVMHLDLALSAVDGVGFVSEQESADACNGLDLVALATAVPHLRTLRISGCQTAVNAGLGAFSATITSLHLADLTIDALTIAQLSQLRQLRALELTRVERDEHPLRALAQLDLHTLVLTDLKRDSALAELFELWPRSLRSVTLSGAWAGHKAMLALSKAVSVERLELRETRVGNFSLNQVKALPNLRDLSLAGATFNDNSPLYVRDLPISTFHCDCPRLGDAGLRSLRHSEGVRHLDLRQSQVTGAGLLALETLHDLESLVLEGRDIAGDGLAALRTHRKLTRLEVSGTTTDPSLTGLRDLVSLTDLRLGYEKLDDRIAAELVELVDLRSLDLSGTEVSDQTLAAISHLTQLRTLKLHHTRITHRGLAHLAPLHHLEVLELDHTDLLDLGTDVLGNLSNLRVLRLDHTLITDATVHHLRALQRLERLNLSNTVVSSAGVAELIELPALEVLGLQDTRVDLRGSAETEVPAAPPTHPQ